MDDSKQGGSKAYPSRTHHGAGYSLEEKHPHLFHWGWFTMAWGYWDGYTKAQIELMALDVPVVNYGSGKSGERTTMSKDEADAMVKQWEKDRGGKTFAGKKHVSIAEIFGEA